MHTLLSSPATGAASLPIRLVRRLISVNRREFLPFDFVLPVRPALEKLSSHSPRPAPQISNVTPELLGDPICRSFVDPPIGLSATI